MYTCCLADLFCTWLEKTPLAHAMRKLRGLIHSPVLQQLLPGRLGLLEASALLQDGFPFHQGRPPLCGASVRCTGTGAVAPILPYRS